jgi:hypothetical protein
MRGEDNGTVKRPACEVLKNPGRWDYIEVEMEECYHTDMLWYMEMQVSINKGYSIRDILKFVSPIHFPDNKRNICSEFVNNALCVADIFSNAGIISPKAVYKRLITKGYTVKELG